jgi:predicted Zn-dependent protease
MRALLLALVVACAPPVAYRAPAFTPSEQAEISRAAAAWNAVTRADHQITEGDAWQVLKEKPPQGYNGECSISRRTIWIDPEHPGASVYDVALHEFGHALGLGHTKTGVMMANTVSTAFTPEVLAECRRAGACR